ncbi:pimeloyl-ACP methyl ester carboxylesterase [Streptosporangium becharense]|uniref:Pimeloyl-ACP methyl ester carboxylesterase n=1 Tax=Streptosporangium becharense TaxID=1816182 RepID=A0A7W9IB97_9ACTN|nr:prolyl oligopeptidase family serine peptidase [Streptosporangium becharense]MBB2910867.1 pimeloyl-ACP methyl ester carboxylesterase [Streptosporangium becharense]MBB5817562.1 pimeloyl-ACP methyl ester carboxylesterase [Streptosporangium becharense]
MMISATGNRAGTAVGARERPFVRRLNFRFSPAGRYAACLAVDGRDSSMNPELWDLTGLAPRLRTVRTRDGETTANVPLSTDEGDLLLCRSGAYGSRLTFASRPDSGKAVEEVELISVRRGGLRLFSGTARIPALVLETDGDANTVVWRLSGRAAPPERIIRLPYPVGGGVWLDESGDRLALVSTEPGTGTMVLDLPHGDMTALGLPGGEHLLLAAPHGGVLLTAARQGGVHRLGVRRPGDRGPTVFPDRLNETEGIVVPLALDPTGRFLALSVTRRARSHLLVHDLVADEASEIALPPGELYPTAHWSGGGLRLIHSTPDRPTGVITVLEPSRPRLLVPRDGRRFRWTAARTRQYPAPVGTTEAVVYGDPVGSRHLVVALHGGPEAAWRLGFDPLFQRLASEDIAVVAPNQRGSTGYGATHRDAVHGAWGGPDLADVLHLGRSLVAERGPDRPRPMLYGASYGAYLALLAAAAEPDLWDRAAVVAPFLSGTLLYEDGPGPVRNLIDRLGGREEIRNDDLGPRDLLRLAGRIRLPLLIVHGERDPIIPVSHSRRLHDRLLQTRHVHGTPTTYLEVSGAGHDPLSDGGGHAVALRVLGFFRAASPGEEQRMDEGSGARHSPRPSIRDKESS